MTYYFATKDSEICYTLDYHIANAKEQGFNTIRLFKAEPETIAGHAFCRAFEAVIETGYCGKSCPDYTPKNGKFGMCKFRSNKFYTPGKLVTVKIKQS